MKDKEEDEKMLKQNEQLENLIIDFCLENKWTDYNLVRHLAGIAYKAIVVSHDPLGNFEGFIKHLEGLRDHYVWEQSRRLERG